MARSSRSDNNLNLGTLPSFQLPRSGPPSAATSPIEPPSTSRFFNGNNSNGAAAAAGSGRLGAGSPLHDMSSGRPYSKRAQELQTEGYGYRLWGGPPASGTSTPLRETIPESPDNDGFPDFNVLSTDLTGSDSASTPRRTRAGTVPSRFPVGGNLGNLGPSGSLAPKTSRPTPSTSPFRPSSSTLGGLTIAGNLTASSNAALLSRLRAGSMPQRSNLISLGSPFGSSLFSNNWNSSRDRSNTLTSIRSSDAPSSPARSAISRDSLPDGDVRTLDYLGLADTPHQGLTQAEIEQMLQSQDEQRASALQALAGEYNVMNKNANRFRSYSVNAKEKYAEEDGDEYDYVSGNQYLYNDTLTPSAAATAQAIASINEAIQQHNIAVQAFASNASANRPRARTAGVLDVPSARRPPPYAPMSSRLDISTAAGLHVAEGNETDILAEAMQHARVDESTTRPVPESVGDNGVQDPSRSLWLGGIPASTTTSSFEAIFSRFGKIESARVLNQKSCGFVNFESVSSSVQAKSQLDGKELFPGAGPIRIGYVKSPSASTTPGHNGLYPSPSPDLFKAQPIGRTPNKSGVHGPSETSSAQAVPPKLLDISGELIRVAKELGTTDEEQARIAAIVGKAMNEGRYDVEIPPTIEPSPSRMFDAPKLREIRKRIDNQAISQAEIEETAIAMLPEIAELSSDYLGNTVVQKLFEYCSEQVKIAMLAEITPHLAEIGIHKNGTWAAQKIIDRAKTPAQINMIVDALRPFGVALLLDQFGNYVMQCCLPFRSPHNDFIFQVMLTNLWDIAQGRFGARAMRACLESHHATKEQQKILAAAITLQSVRLATNANGALLLTWYLDTCSFSRRRTVLASNLVPHLVQLCTHKVAYLTVLKLINQKQEPEAHEIVIKALFFSPHDQTLKDILCDQTCGSTLIYKILTSPFFDESIRAEVTQNIRNVLLRLKVQPSQGYKRLMDEVGMSTRSGTVPVRVTQHGPRSPAPNGIVQRNEMSASFTNQFYPSATQQFESRACAQRTVSGELPNFESYPANNVNGMSPQPFNPNSNYPLTPISPPHFQLQQQQQQQQTALLNASQPPHQSHVYPGTNGMGGYASPAPSLMDPFRNTVRSPIAHPAMSASPMMGGQPGFGGPPQGYGGMSPMVGGYGYPMQYMSPHINGGGGRRGRR